MSKPKAQIVGLKTLDLRGVLSPMSRHTPHRAHKKRVFTEDEWRFLHTRTDEDLARRILQGDNLIALLNRPEMVNMVAGEAARIASNLRYQQDAIREILKGRQSNLIKE